MKIIHDFAVGRSVYSTYFILVFSFSAPIAIFFGGLLFQHLVLSMLVLFGVIVLYSGIYTFFEAISSTRWPVVKATLISSKLSSKSHSETRMMIYRLEFVAEYIINNKSFSGGEYDFSASYGPKDEVQKQRESIENTAELLLHYKPSDPKISVVHPGLRLVHLLRPLSGIILIACAYFIYNKYLS